MPNWCDNMLRISGDMKDVMGFHEKFLARRKEYVVGRLDKNGESESVIVSDPEPNLWMWNTYAPEGEELVKYPYDGYWYDWNCNHWGVKWDLRDQRFEIGDDFIEYYFRTPWGPPSLWIDKMAQDHPTINWNCEWDEEGGFYGEMIWEDGDMVHGFERNHHDPA